MKEFEVVSSNKRIHQFESEKTEKKELLKEAKDEKALKLPEIRNRDLSKLSEASNNLNHVDSMIRILLKG